MKKIVASGFICGLIVLTFALYRAAFTQNPNPRVQFPEQLQKAMADPFKGVTADGRVVPGLFKIRSTGVSTRPVRLAAEAFLKSLSDEQRKKMLFPIDHERHSHGGPNGPHKN
ncbi:MAG: hypothetical protein ACREEM_47250 [Blastocatellia bacterium]